jgi:ribonuclease J
MRLVVHRGTREIGGSCIEVTTPAARVVLDLGLPLVTATREPFDAQAALRKSAEDLRADGTLPRVAGLFTPDHSAPDAILLSHAHLDHIGLVHFSRPEIPVYATRGTSKMMLAGAVFAGRPGLDRGRHRVILAGEPFAVNDLTVTPFAVDHSTFGSVAFLLEAGGKTLLYSGDLRTHGRKPGMARALLERVSPKAIDVFLTEGTHLGGEAASGISEFDLEEQVVELTRTDPGLVLAAFSPQDVDRVVTFYRAGRRTGRTFVADAYTAFVLRQVAGESHIPRPTRDKGIRVFHNAAFRRKRAGRLRALFEPDRIDLPEILSAPAGHLMVFRPSMTDLDFGGTLPDRVRVIYSYWLGYLGNADWVDLRDRVGRANGDFVPAHASGHIHVNDLLALVRAVGARAIIPVHTFEPQILATHFPNIVLLADGQAYEVS